MLLFRTKCSCLSNRSFIFGLLIGISLVLLFRILQSTDYTYTYTFHGTVSPHERLGRTTDLPAKVLQTILDATECKNVPLKTRYAQRGPYWVLYNFVKATQQFKCYETVTFATQGTFQYLENVVALVERWRGPVSVAVHAPGTDFRTTLDVIAYLRNCASPLVKKFVTFHLFFDEKHTPKLAQFRKKPIETAYRDSYDCRSPSPIKPSTKSFRSLFDVPYAINVARNVAKESSQTHYVLVADIELYPSVNLIPRFLKMLASKPVYLRSDTPHVYVLPVFEVPVGQKAPVNKTQLLQMVANKTAVVFHQNICTSCHKVIGMKDWLGKPESEGLDVVASGKRLGSFSHWEPFYIGTKDEPVFDERLTWEGQSNKMTQNYIMCVLGYDFHVLDNGFLVHKPAKPAKNRTEVKLMEMAALTRSIITHVIRTELDVLYGGRSGCAL